MKSRWLVCRLIMDRMTVSNSYDQDQVRSAADEILDLGVKKRMLIGGMRDLSFRKSCWLYIPMAMFIVFRSVLIFSIYKATNGVEFTSDLWVFELGLKPFSVITFASSASSYSQPPLFPMALAPFAIPLSQIFDRFLAARISFTFFELIAVILLAWYLFLSDKLSQKKKLLILSVMVFSPLGFMTGAVMKQEEAIVMVFTAAVLLAIKKGSLKWASILTFLGMITAKILFGVVFFALLIFAHNRKTVLNWGLYPAVAGLTVYSLIGYYVTGTIPFVGFNPANTKFCASIFTLMLYFGDFSAVAIKWLSLSIAGIVFMVILSLKSKALHIDFPSAMLVSFCVLFLFFYHVNTEYHIFILPLLALIPNLGSSLRKASIYNGLHLILAASTWGFGIIYGIRQYSEGGAFGSSSKQMALNIYNKIFGFIPIKSFEIALLVLTLISISLMLTLAYKTIEKQTSLSAPRV